MAKSKLGLESLDLAEIVRLVVKSFHLDPCRSNFSHFEFDNYIVFFVKFGFNVLGLVFHHGMAPDFLTPLFFPPIYLDYQHYCNFAIKNVSPPFRGHNTFFFAMYFV